MREKHPAVALTVGCHHGVAARIAPITCHRRTHEAPIWTADRINVCRRSARF